MLSCSQACILQLFIVSICPRTLRSIVLHLPQVVACGRLIHALSVDRGVVHGGLLLREAHVRLSLQPCDSLAPVRRALRHVHAVILYCGSLTILLFIQISDLNVAVVWPSW